MEIEVIRMVADALADATIGVNAKLPGVPRDGGDAVPPNVVIADATRDNWVARRAVALGDLNIVLPAIAVSIFRPAEVDGEIETTDRQGVFDVLLEYIVRKSNTKLATQHGAYTMRTVLCVLDWFNKNENAALRTRNNVALTVCTRRFIQPLWAEREDAVVTAAIVATYQVRDLTPSW